MRLTFADCVFDSGTREISRGGRTVPISPKALRLLEILVERRPNAVSKVQLHEILWPSTFVADANLPNLVAELRAGLGDDAQKSRIVRTVPRFGYAFCAEAAPVPSGPGRPVVFKLIWRGREIALDPGANVLGRDPLCVACIDVGSVSRRHARIVVLGDTATVEDLGSRNGTFLKGQVVVSPRVLSDGDNVRIGTVEMTVRRYVGGVPTEPVQDP
jgi:FHA domain/Transcriptional regulatory protein, C terminal